jgi:hypothetical protein
MVHCWGYNQMTTADDAWIVWTTQGVVRHINPSTNDTSNRAWTQWTNGTASNIYVPQRQFERHVETPAQHAALEARAAQYRREQAARSALEAKIREEAQQRAEALLLGVLSAPQRQQYARDRWLLVRGRSGRLYRVRRGRVANVDVLDANGVVLHRLCCHPPGDMPDEDVMIAQLMHLTYNDDTFCRKANVHPLLAPERVALPASMH